MDSSSGVCLDSLDKLRDDNFQTWKARIQLIPSLKEVEGHLTEDPPPRKSESYAMWHKSDHKARVIIGLTLSDTHLERVHHASTTKTTWKLICDIFEKHTLLNKLAARRRFYTAQMQDNEKVLVFATRISQLAATLKAMDVDIGDGEMAMALLDGLPDRFVPLISALVASHINENNFTFEFVLSRCVPEEQRHMQRHQDAPKAWDSAALLAIQSGTMINKLSAEVFVHCGKHRDSSKCYKKILTSLYLDMQLVLVSKSHQHLITSL